MNREEVERAFAQRLPVMARISGITAEKCVLSFSCIYAIRRRWDEKLGREVTELELLDRNRRGLVTAGLDDVFFDEEEGAVEAAFTKCRRVYERYFGLLTPKVSEEIDFYLREGVEPELINRVIEYAHEQGKHSWSYIYRILMNKLKENIKTLEAFEIAEAKWKERRQQSVNHPQQKKNKFNNYTDTNAGFLTPEQILEDMLEG